jgi:hypothetical protein
VSYLISFATVVRLLSRTTNERGGKVAEEEADVPGLDASGLHGDAESASCTAAAP